MKLRNVFALTFSLLLALPLSACKKLGSPAIVVNDGGGGGGGPTVDPKLDPDNYGATLTIAFDPATMIDAVADYGATGDGVTDDTDAINAALAYAKISGEFVWLKDGIYMHDEFIRVDSAKLVGQSKNTILRATAGLTGPGTPLGDNVFDYESTRTIHVTGANVHVKNLTLDAINTQPRMGSPTSDGIHVLATDAVIEHITVNGGTGAEGFFNAGIHVDSWDNVISNVLVKRCKVINTNADRIRAAAWNTNTMTNVTFRENMSISLAGGADGDDDFSFIANNTTQIITALAEDNVSLGPKKWGAGMNMQGTDGGIMRRNHIDHEGNGKAPGIIIAIPSAYPSPDMVDLLIEDNVLIGTGRDDYRGPLGAIALDEGNISDVTIQDNSITESIEWDFTGYGHMSGTKSNILFRRNTNPTGAAMLVDSLYMTDVTIEP